MGRRFHSGVRVVQKIHRWFIAFMILMVSSLVIAGCMQSSLSVTNITPVPSAGISEPPAGVSADLQNIVNSGIAASGVPGLVVEIATPSWTWDFAAGNASAITGEPAQPGMKFFIASVTKSFTSVAVIKLAEEGKLSLDDPISKWLDPGLVQKIPNGKNITVRQLLQHTSGIADYDEEAILWQELADQTTAVPYETGIAQGINASPLFLPGTDYEYSNVNYLLLTKIVDKASGMPYEEYVNQTVFVPAGLHNTTFQRTNAISGPHMTASEQINGTREDFSDLYVGFDRGAGDIVSTTADLNRFHRALREGRLISNASLTEMERSSAPASKAEGNVTSGYGLGYGVRHDAGDNTTIVGHSGSYPGSFTYWYYIPETDSCITMNVNTQVNGSAVASEIFYPLVRYLSH